MYLGSPQSQKGFPRVNAAAHPVRAALPGEVRHWEHQCSFSSGSVSPFRHIQSARGTFFLIPGAVRKHLPFSFFPDLLFFKYSVKKCTQRGSISSHESNVWENCNLMKINQATNSAQRLLTPLRMTVKSTLFPISSVPREPALPDKAEGANYL